MKAISCFIISFLFFIPAANKQDADCSKLQAGLYKVQFDHKRPFSWQKDYTIRFTNNRYTKYFQNGDSATGKFEWDDECNLFLDPDVRINPDTLSPSDRVWYYTCGMPYFTIENSTGDTTGFIAKCNPHVMLFQGVFIKQAD